MPGDLTVDIGKLAEPLSRTVDLVREMFHYAFGPSLLLREARARASARVLSAATDIEIAALEAAATERQRVTELRRQRNLDVLFAKAIPLLPPALPDARPDPDWCQAFVNTTQDIGSEQMQELWARVLAAEVSRPGSFSYRSMQTLKLMDRNEALSFIALCSHCLTLDRNHFLIEPEGLAGYLSGVGLEPLTLENLRASGLLCTTPLQLLDSPALEYFGTKFVLTQTSSVQSPEPVFPLSSVGEALFPICGAKAVPGFLDRLFHALEPRGYAVGPVPGL